MDLEDTCIIYFHGNDWDGIPARQRYLMAEVSRIIPVFYLDYGEEVPGGVTWHKTSDRLTVIRGLIRTFQKLTRFRLGFLNGPYAKLALRSIRQKYRQIIFWAAENTLQPFRFIPHDVLIFDSIDPCFSGDPSVLRAHDRRERMMLKRADVVFASAETLAQRCRVLHPNVTLLNNACEPAEYTPLLLETAARPTWWPTVKRPIGAYLGSLDWRLDGDSLLEACLQNPEVHFVLAGSKVPGAMPELSRLLALPNVTAPGRISIEDGRYLLANCAFGLVPFTPGEMNDAVNPVKMYAYALLGKPILGTAIHELRIRPEIAQVASDQVAFGRMVPGILSLAANILYQESLHSFALANTWKHRAATALDVLRRLPRNSVLQQRSLEVAP